MCSTGLADLFYREKRCCSKLIQEVGLSLPIDSSCNDELLVKGISQDEFRVGKWQLLELDEGNMVSLLEEEHRTAISNGVELDSCTE